MAHLIPEYVLRHIVSFLPYNERVEINQILPLEYRITKKIESDIHNYRVKSKLIFDKLERINNAVPNSIEKIRDVEKLFLYLLDTKDECLFSMTSPKFHEAVKDRARLHATDDGYVWTVRNKYPDEVASLMEVSARLLSYMDTKTPGKGVGVGKLVTVE